MSPDQSRLLSALQSERGRDFDRGYANQQVLAHEQALTLMQGYAEQGPPGPLRDAARTDLAIIRRHLEMARKLKAALGG
jgi:putative membrane protein